MRGRVGGFVNYLELLFSSVDVDVPPITLKVWLISQKKLYVLFLFIHFIFSLLMLLCTLKPLLAHLIIHRSQQYIFFNNFFLLSLFPPSCCFSQTIIPNLTSYSIYIVYVQAASLSTYKPHRMLLGSHSASRKVNLMCFFAPLSFVCSTRAHGGLRELENSCEFSVSCESATAAVVLLCRVLHSWGILLDSRRMRISGIAMEWRR